MKRNARSPLDYRNRKIPNNKLKTTKPAVPAILANKVQLYPVQDMQFLLFDGPDLISQTLRSGKLWEDFLVDLIKHFLTMVEKPIFIDIGANLGAITVPVGKYIQVKQGKVISFEAQRGVYYQLCGNIFSNKLINTCTAYNIAIGNVDTEIDIPVLDLSAERSVGALSLDKTIRAQQKLVSTPLESFEKIQLKPIDSLNLPVASLVKIDVEGLELEVLQGAQTWLKSSQNPPILFEVWGDYMKELIPKREQLMLFVHEVLGYETFLYGELCIAQHPTNKFFEINMTEEGNLSMKKLKITGP